MYSLLRILVSFAFRLIFKKVYIVGEENIPKDRPTILVCNHPSGFIEPLVLACFVKVPLYFLVRGDLFDKPLLRLLLVSTNQIPIFRFRDGMAGMRKNNESIRYIVDVLNRKKHLLIFAEGSTKQVRYIRPLQKGTAKIAFEALTENPDMDLCIVPIGMTLTTPDRFRGQVAVEIGKPIEVIPSLDEYKTEPQKTIRSLTKVIKEAMIPLVPHIQNKELAPDLETLLNAHKAFYYPTTRFPLVSRNRDAIFESLVRSTSFINKSDEPIRNKLKSNVEKMNISIYVDETKISWNILSCLLLAIPALLGFLLNCIPNFIGKKIADETVKEVEFYTAVRLAASLGVYFIYCIILLLIALFIWGKAGVLLILFVPTLGYIFVQWQDIFKTLKTQLNKRKWTKEYSTNQKKLYKDIHSLIDKTIQ